MSYLLVAEALAWDERNLLDKLPPPPLVTIVAGWLAKGVYPPDVTHRLNFGGPCSHRRLNITAVMRRMRKSEGANCKFMHARGPP